MDQDSKSPHRSAAAARPVAVAVRRQNALDRAPRVTAKGEGAVAEQILAIAFERDVKVRADADLAEILRAVEIDSEVPLAALAAVAEILSYVYRANRAPTMESEP